MKNWIKKLELRISDLLLLVGFIPFALFLVFGQELMQYQNPADVGFPLAAIIACFLVSLVSWGAYLFLEYKRGNVKIGYVAYILIGLALLNVIVIACQPSAVDLSVLCRVTNPTDSPIYVAGQSYNVHVDISAIHKVFFSLDIILICLFIFIGLFVFPKRFKSISFIKYLGFAVMAFCLVVILYSYIFESSNYINFIKCIFSGDFSNIYNYTVKSFIIHRNAFGMAMLMGIIFAIINHSFDKKWYHYLILGFFYVSMIFSFCKASLLIGALITAIYVYFRLIYAFKDNKKRNTILLIVYSSIIVIGAGIVGISLISKGKFLSPIYELINGNNETSTLTMRSHIWDNCYQLLEGGNWVVGRGFGIFNLMLLPMNTINGDIVFPSHSAWMNMLTEGGIFYLFALIALTALAIYIMIKSYKKNPNLVIAMALGAFAFFLYSFIETIHYLFYVFLLPPFIFYEVEKQKEATTLQNS